MAGPRSANPEQGLVSAFGVAVQGQGKGLTEQS